VSFSGERFVSGEIGADPQPKSKRNIENQRAIFDLQEFIQKGKSHKNADSERL